MKVNRPVAFNRKKYNLNCKSYIHKIKTTINMTNYEKLLQIPI